MFVQWNQEQHGIDIEVIDTQHQELFILTNQLHDLIEAEARDGEAIIKVLKRLYAYTGFHFVSEEGLFREYGYPGVEEHIVVHESFRKKIKEYLDDFRDKPNMPLESLQDFLVEWIIGHIIGDDRHYAEYFEANNIVPELYFSPAQNSRSEDLNLWQQKKLELEIKTIDDQHKQLIAILQQTNDLQHTSEARKLIFLPIIIKKLFYYTQFHFSYEEEHMAKNSYPLLHDHQEQHKHFIGEIVKFANEYKEGRIRLTDEIILFLRDWTVNHILEEDRKYKRFLDSLEA
jgi:hemerythrin-like metal-binding protein